MVRDRAGLERAPICVHRMPFAMQDDNMSVHSGIVETAIDVLPVKAVRVTETHHLTLHM